MAQLSASVSKSREPGGNILLNPKQLIESGQFKSLPHRRLETAEHNATAILGQVPVEPNQHPKRRTRHQFNLPKVDQDFPIGIPFDQLSQLRLNCIDNWSLGDSPSSDFNDEAAVLAPCCKNWFFRHGHPNLPGLR